MAAKTQVKPSEKLLDDIATRVERGFTSDVRYLLTVVFTSTGSCRSWLSIGRHQDHRIRPCGRSLRAKRRT